MRTSALLGCFAVVLLASASAQAQQPLKTGVDGTFAPHAMPKLPSGVEGFNVDLANEIARRLKRPISIDAVQFSAWSRGFRRAPMTSLPHR